MTRPRQFGDSERRPLSSEDSVQLTPPPPALRARIGGEVRRPCSAKAPNPDIRHAVQARMGRITSPCTSVSRKSRPA